MKDRETRRGPFLLQPLLWAWAMTLIIVAVAGGFAGWGVVCLGMGIVIAMGVGYGHVIRSWSVPLSIAMLVTPIGMVAMGAMYEATWGLPFAAAGIGGLIVTAAAAGIHHELRSRASTSPRSALDTTHSAHHSAELDRLAHQIDELRELSLLSDSARLLLHGDRDRATVHTAIEGRIRAGQLDEATRLCDGFESSFGQGDDTDAFRSMIEDSRNEQQQHENAAMLSSFEAALRRGHWAAATEEAARLKAQVPDSPLVEDLDERITAAKHQQKLQLEQRLAQASEADDVDSAMSILRELDKYMTRDEAERLSTEAQSIIQRHRDRLGTQFQVAVQEKHWTDAARHGNEIISAYPNTKMATEVRSMIEVIRTRATQTAIEAHSGA